MASDETTTYYTSNFVVELGDKSKDNFKSASLPEITVEVNEYRDGSEEVPYPRKEMGTVSVGDLTLTAGATEDTELHDWYQEISEEGQITQAKQDVAVQFMSPDGENGPRFEFTNAWPTEYEPASGEGGSSELGETTVTIQFDKMERTG